MRAVSYCTHHTACQVLYYTPMDTTYLITFSDLRGALDCVLVSANNDENAKYRVHNMMPAGWKIEGCIIASPEERKIWDWLGDYDFS